MTEKAWSIAQLVDAALAVAPALPTETPPDRRRKFAGRQDLFRAIRSGKADVVTGEIETFTETGLRMTSGAEIDADVIVTATGLKMKLMGGMELVVDGAKVDPRRR